MKGAHVRNTVQRRGHTVAAHRVRSPVRWLSAAFSALLLFVLYRSLDIAAVGAALRQAHPVWLIVSLGMVVPITLLRALRLTWVMPAGAVPGYAEAVRLTLVASAFNTFLPSKAGDLVKGFFVARSGGTSANVAVAAVVYERLADLFGLLVWCVAGWLYASHLPAVLPRVVLVVFALAGGASGVLVLSTRAANGLFRALAHALPQQRLAAVRKLAEGWPLLHTAITGKRLRIVIFSLFLWLVQLTQIWLFALALSVAIPFAACASIAAVALMAGQLPVTFNGFGARDVALVALLRPWTTPETAAAVGLLTATRVLIPPLAALPILRPYLAAIVNARRAWRRA